MARTSLPDGAKSRAGVIVTCAVLVAIAAYIVIQLASYGGIFVPVPGTGYGSGFYVLAAPASIDPYHGHDHHGSEVFAAAGSIGRLKDSGAGDDTQAQICDKFANGKNAHADTYRKSNGEITKFAQTYDANGVGSGCGNEIIGFSGEFHRAWEGQSTGPSVESNHTGF